MAWLANLRTISQNAPNFSVPGQFFKTITTSAMTVNCCTINKNIIVLADNALETMTSHTILEIYVFPFTIPHS